MPQAVQVIQLLTALQAASLPVIDKPQAASPTNCQSCKPARLPGNKPASLQASNRLASSLQPPASARSARPTQTVVQLFNYSTILRHPPVAWLLCITSGRRRQLPR